MFTAGALLLLLRATQKTIVFMASPIAIKFEDSSKFTARMEGTDCHCMHVAYAGKRFDHDGYHL